MNRSPRPGRISSKLSQSTHQRLNMYAAAAGAAGVSLLALAPKADAKIIYTPTHQSILGPHGYYKLDLNHDGLTDFTIGNTTFYNTDQAFWNVFAKGPQGNEVAGTFVYRGFPVNAHVFGAGVPIGPGEHFFEGEAKLASFYVGGGGYSAHGNWVNIKNCYLGLKFQAGGQTHYGWARFTVRVTEHPVNIYAELTGYAYETTPDTAIIAGKTSGTDVEELPEAVSSPSPAPAALGLLAMGSPGLAVWRREE